MRSFYVKVLTVVVFCSSAASGYALIRPDTLDQLTGAANYAGCRNCQNKNLTFFECFHLNPPQNANCDGTKCIINFYAWFHCDQTPKGCQDNCATQIGNNDAYRSQTANQNVNNNCIDNGFVAVPNTEPVSQCVPQNNNGGGQPTGKCFIPNCGGNFWQQGATFNGLEKCQ